MKLPDPAVTLMEIAINRALKLDDFSFQKMVALQGKIIGIELLGLNLCFYLAPVSDGMQVLSSVDQPASVDTWIRGTPLSMLKTAITDDKSSLFKGDITIEGDMALGQNFQRILDGLDIDWEEPLSQIIGNVAAHQLGEFVRGASQWVGNSVDSVSKTTGEYFQEETRDIVSPVEVERFVDNVDKLRSDTDRLVLVLEKLQNKIRVV